MPFFVAVRLALIQIRAQKLKSFFAVFGVIIGVMFLMTVVSVLEGMNRYMEEDFAHKLLSMGEAVATEEQRFQDYLLR